jgi:hypothetical protein
MATARSTIETSHVGFGSGFIEENQPFNGDGFQAKGELFSANNDIRTLLLAGS